VNLILRWRNPEPRIATRWRGPAGLAEAIEREPLYPVAAVVGPPGTGSDPIFPALSVAADATVPAPAGGTGAGAWSTVLNEPVFWDGTAWRTLAHFVTGIPPVEPGPTFIVDFTSGTLGPAVTLARAAGPASWYNQTGLMQKTMSANVARFDHDPVTFAPRGLLVEPAATNLLVNSENISTWDNVRNVITADAATAPDGTTTADKLAADATGPHRHIVYETAATVNGQRYTLSGHFKPAGHNAAGLVLAGSSVSYGVAYDLAAGTVGTNDGFGSPSGTGAAIATAGNGYFRASLTMDTDATSTFVEYADAISASPGAWYLAAPSIVGDESNGIHVWGAQIELGSVATTYIPTAGSTATRAADSLTVTVPAGYPQLLVTYDDDSTSLVACAEGANVYTAADFARSRIKRMEGVA
jgi:hypothetical protein